MADTKPIAAEPNLATRGYVMNGLTSGLGGTSSSFKLEGGKVWLLDDKAARMFPVALKNKQMIVLEA